MNKAVIQRTVLYCILLLLVQAQLQAEIYRWVDQEGQVHFSDAENKPEHIKQAEEVIVDPNVVDVRPGLKPGKRQPKQAAEPDNGKKLKKQSDQITMLARKKAKCVAAKEKLEKVRQQMRAGYTARQYRRLHEREIRYMEQRQHYCH